MPTEGRSALQRRDTSRDSSRKSTPSTRRRFLGGAAAGGAAALGGCLTGLTGGSGVRGGTKSGGGSADVINVAAVYGSGELFQRLVNEYVEDDAGVEVDVSLFPFANLFEKTNSVLGTKGDAYDIMFMADIWLPQFGPHCEPIKKWLPGKYPSNAMVQACIEDGMWPTPNSSTVQWRKAETEEALRGQVVVGNNQMFAYNRAYYERVGEKTPPKTWDDVLRAGRKIDERIDGVDGYVIRGKRGNPITSNYYCVGAAKAGDMFDKNWRFTWDQEQGIDAVKFYINDLKSISPSGVASFNSDAVLNRVGSGRAAQGAVWPAAASLLLNPEKSEAANDVELTVCPKGGRRAPTIGTWMTTINKYVSDSKKEAAGKVIKSFISRKAQEKYVELGGIPFRKDIFEDYTNSQPWFDALYRSLQQSVWRPRTPLWSEMEVMFGKYLNTALTGQITAEQAMRKANNQFERMLKQSGYYSQ